METQLKCSNCGQSILVEDSSAGQTLTCPKCGQNFTVPPAQVDGSAAAAERSAADPGLQRILGPLNSVLVAGEALEAWAVQRRWFARIHRRVLVAATSGRFIALERKLFGGYDVVDFRWQDLREAKLRVGIFGADLTFGIARMADLASAGSTSHFQTYTGLRKDQAQQIYRIAQAQDQAWREKRRVRELEEMRAKSGGVQFASSPLGSASPQGGDSATRLQQAKQMLDSKLISDSEYEAIKARIISGV